MADIVFQILQDGVENAITRLQQARGVFNAACDNMEPWQVALYAIITWGIVSGVWRFVFNGEPLLGRVMKATFRFAKAVPFIRGLIDAEMNKNLKEIGDKFKPGPNEKFHRALPAKGVPQRELLKEVEALQAMGEVEWHKGKVSGAVYHGGKDWGEFLGKVCSMFIWTNPLHPDVFPGVRKMEAEIIAMVLDMYHGGPESCGSVTSGGTESILMACKTHRDRGYDNGITEPNIVVPVTAHAAFDKAAHYFGMKIRHAPVDERTRKVNVRAMARLIDSNTVMIAGSAISYPHGSIDPIEELAVLARRHDIGLHVDCCLGGFIVPFMEEAGFSTPLFDFRVPGVTSISCDTHKYGYSPKGSSVVMYASERLRRYQYFIQPNWPGGIYGSPAIAGSRAGAIIAGTWAALVATGRAGYVESTRKIVEATRKIADAIRQIDGLFVYGDVEASVVGWGSNDFDIYRLSSVMNKRGWNLSSLQYPSSIHLCVTLLHTEPGVVEDFVNDLRTGTAEIMKTPRAKATGSAAMYGMAQGIPDRKLIEEIASGYLDITCRVDPSQAH